MRKERLKKAAYARKIRIFLGFLLFLAIGGAFIFWSGRQIYYFCLTRAVRTTPAQAGTLSVAYPASGIVLRNETVVAAPIPGKLIPLAPEGKRVRAGAVVARLEGLPDLERPPGRVELRSPQAGFLCYHLDGWEGVLTPDNWERLDLLLLFKNINKSTGRIENIARAVNTGEPVFKVIDNLVSPCLILKIEHERPLTFNAGDKVDLEWEGAKKGRGRVLAWRKIPGGLVINVELLEANSSFLCSRFFRLRVADRKYEGVIVPVCSLARTEKGIGVYTSSPVGFKFQKVDLIGRLGDRAAVQGISPGVEVVLNPELLKRIKRENIISGGRI